MKFALVSYVLPPSWSGQAMMLYRLLRDLPPERYCLVTLDEGGGHNGQEFSERLPGRYHFLPPEFRLTRGHRFGGAQANILVGLVWQIAVRARRIARIVKEEKCEAIVGCSGGHDFVYFPAAYLASRLAGVPFYAYLFDDYATQWISPLVRFVARRLEPFIMKGAQGIVAHSEFLRDELRERYGVESIVIHNPCDLSDYEKELPPEQTDVDDAEETRIVYTGAISDGQFGALRNLLAAIERLGRPGVKLHLYTAQSPEYWGARGLRGAVVFHEHQTVFAIPAIQRRADLLFLGLAFDSPYPEHIKTASPGKTGEYLAARRPILVHAPPDSFVVWYFRTHDCGLVVDADDPEALARALARLLEDEELRGRLTEKAWQRARADFSTETAQAKFVRLLEAP
ncbi:MAG TPA: glycosyltransferase [Pyrinomonadaceae bacterium]|nr:glycosyltransferase [Pyrinomonadaceae bacterium]